MWSGSQAKFRELMTRTARFIQRLPYSPELRPAYVYIGTAYARDYKDKETAMKWYQALEERATSHNDLTALGHAGYEVAQMILHRRGDLHGAISQHQRALD